ncbi:hypothetical protein [Kitasatospora sp. NPDC088351]|uniref:hypothetical protein n=1 Tax=Kitasatospora sp. NPDC088351 TaxID=3155180 RepID=UPI00343CFA45
MTTLSDTAWTFADARNLRALLAELDCCAADLTASRAAARVTVRTTAQAAPQVVPQTALRRRRSTVDGPAALAA